MSTATAEFSLSTEMSVEQAFSAVEDAIKAGVLSPDKRVGILSAFVERKARQSRPAHADKGDPRPVSAECQGRAVSQLRNTAGTHQIGWVSLDAAGWELLVKAVENGTIGAMLKDFAAGTCPKSAAAGT